MSKDFKITLIVIFSIIGVVVLFMGTVNLFMYQYEISQTKNTIKIYPEIVEYLKNDYGNNLKIIHADQRGADYFEILVSDDFENKNEEVSKKLYDISQEMIYTTKDKKNIQDRFSVRFIFSDNYLDNKYIEFEYYNGSINDISLNFAITQKELDKLSENNTKVHGYSLK